MPRPSNPTRFFSAGRRSFWRAHTDAPLPERCQLFERDIVHPHPFSCRVVLVGGDDELPHLTSVRFARATFRRSDGTRETLDERDMYSASSPRSPSGMSLTLT
jgi:hypothetical protein